jgi:hypothetical protein
VQAFSTALSTASPPWCVETATWNTGKMESHTPMEDRRSYHLQDQLLEYWYGGHHILTRTMLPEEVIHYTQLHLNELFFWDSYFFTELEGE